MRPTFGGPDTRLARKELEPTTFPFTEHGAELFLSENVPFKPPATNRRPKDKTSGRALPEVSEVYQKAAKEFHWLP
jgi:hypothetical protein